MVQAASLHWACHCCYHGGLAGYLEQIADGCKKLMIMTVEQTWTFKALSRMHAKKGSHGGYKMLPMEVLSVFQKVHN